MAKIFTANEMRARANLESNTWGDRTTAAMLRQAADALEREEKRGGSELDGWRKQALEENAALDIAREQLAKKDEIIKQLADTLKWCHGQADAIGKATLIGCLQMDALTITMAGMARRCGNAIVKAKGVTK